MSEHDHIVQILSKSCTKAMLTITRYSHLFYQKSDKAGINKVHRSSAVAFFLQWVEKEPA